MKNANERNFFNFVEGLRQMVIRYDNMTNKWIFWPDGQYYDSTYQIWRNWDGKWTGYWKGQKQWFIWDSGKVLDLETLLCVTNCDASKYQISSSQYSTGELWRLQLSTQNLGTRQKNDSPRKMVHAEFWQL